MTTDKEFIDKINSKWFRWVDCPLCGKEYWDESAKTELDLKARSFFEISCYEIENQVEKHLGLIVEIIPDDELHNGYSPVTMVSAEDHTEDIEKWKKGRQWSMSLNSWIEHLAFLNVLPEGDFLVDHSW